MVTIRLDTPKIPLVYYPSYTILDVIRDEFNVNTVKNDTLSLCHPYTL
ncbi:MAG: hypothetical protein PVS3B3_07900 [Ktedonobacteraceae bacterium]